MPSPPWLKAIPAHVVAARCSPSDLARAPLDRTRPAGSILHETPSQRCHHQDPHDRVGSIDRRVLLRAFAVAVKDSSKALSSEIPNAVCQVFSAAPYVTIQVEARTRRQRRSRERARCPQVTNDHSRSVRQSRRWLAGSVTDHLPRLCPSLPTTE